VANSEGFGIVTSTIRKPSEFGGLSEFGGRSCDDDFLVAEVMNITINNRRGQQEE